MAIDPTATGPAGGSPPISSFGVYEIRALLGAGGMGQVYRAFDSRLGREIALKVIRRSAVDDESALDRLLREATLASALNHPNIVTIYETGVVGADRYIAMELIEGATLRQLAAQGLPLSRIVGIARQVAEALAVAHAQQIVHRDIKPDNVMVRPDGYVKLLDFGLARAQPDRYGSGATGAGTASTEAGLILGTIGYMAPEQARGETVSAEADVFSLGVLLYELVTGRHPFMAASQLGTLNALLWETPEPPSLLNPELPRALDQLILESLQKDQRLRPGASEVMYRLALAHDSNIATALSSVTVAPRRLAASTNVVGREDELAAISHEFERAQKGKARMLVVSGEAGVGKTTLVDAFVSELEERGEPVRVGRGRCSERLAGTEAYLPVLEALESLQRSEQLGSLTRLVRALAPSWYAQLMPPSENDSSAARLAAETAGGSQERLKREIAALLEEAGRMQPIVLWFDDRALGRSVDDRSHRLPGPAAGQHATADHRDGPTVRAGAVATSVPRAEARPRGAWPLPRNHADLPERSRDRALHCAAVPGPRVSFRLCRHDSRSHRGQSALHGRCSSRSAAPSDHRPAGRPLGDDRERIGDRPRDARIGTQPDSAKDGRARRCRSTPARCRQRAGHGLRLGDRRGRRPVGRGRGRITTRPAGAGARARALRRRARGAGPHAHAALPFRASHVPERVFRVAACDAQSRARAARSPSVWRLGTASRRSVSPTSRCCSKSRETACAPPNTGTAPPRLLDGFTRTTNRRAWRSAGSACSRTSRTVRRARPPSSGCR